MDTISYTLLYNPLYLKGNRALILLIELIRNRIYYPHQFFHRNDLLMARTTVTLPNSIHQQLLNIAKKEKDTLSYTVAKLVEIGLLVINKQENERHNDRPNAELDTYCQKLIIQMNGILKQIAVEHFNFNNEQIAQITQETLNKFNQLQKN